MAAALRFPADPALRRQLWRQWVHLDPPRGDPAVTPMRRVHVEPRSSPQDWADVAIEATPGVVDGLRTAIAAAVVDGQLSLADRQRFMTRAVRLGLSRFDASLLVASVQHRTAAANDLRVVRQWKQRPAKAYSVTTLVSALVAIEGMLVLGVACWLRT